MASSGSFNTSGYGDRYLQFTWSVQSQSVANNTTTIAWTLKGAGGGTNNWYAAGNFYVSINGVQVYASATRINLYNGTVVASGTYTISHNNSGAASFSAYAQAGIYTYAVNCSGGGSWSLPTIARYPQIQSASNFNDTGNPSLTFTNPAKLWPLKCKVEAGGNTQLITRNVDKSATSYTFSLTEAERNKLRALCPNSKTLAVIITVCAMSGNTELSASYLGRTMTVVDANPTFNASYKDTNDVTVGITENDQKIIRNQSNLQISVTNLSAKKSATIRTVTCAIAGRTYTGTVSGASCTFNIGAVNASSNTTATVTVTDSRGFSTSQNLTIQMIDWQLPTAIITMARHNNYYSPTDLTVDGSYSSVANKNRMTIQYRIRKSSTNNLFDYPHLYIQSVDGLTDTLNGDGSLTTTGTPTSGKVYITTPTDITDLLEDGQQYTISQQTASGQVFIEVVAVSEDSTTTMEYSCDSENSVTFTVDKSTYAHYVIDIRTTGTAAIDVTNVYSLEKGTPGWSAWTTIQDNVTTTFTADNDFAWDVQVKVSDLFGSTTYNLTLSRGMPIVFFDRLKSSTGFNCFPIDQQSVEVNGVNIMPSVMTRSLSAQITNLAVNTYTVIPLDLQNSAGSRLTATNDGGIEIGAGVTKIKVSGNMAVETVTTAGNRHVRIVKNNYSAANTLGWGWDNLQSGDSESITINPQLVNVKEGDVIYLYYYTGNSADKIGGNAQGGRTSLTVEVVA